MVSRRGEQYIHGTRGTKYSLVCSDLAGKKCGLDVVEVYPVQARGK